MASNRFPADALERIGFTTLEVAAGLAIVELADIPGWWVAPLAAGLAALKAWAAKHIGVRGTASTLPATADPAGPSPAVYGGP